VSLLTRLLGRLLRRLVPALLTASGVTLLVAGLLSYDATAGPSPTPPATTSPSPAPTSGPTPSPGSTTPGPSESPAPGGVASRIAIPALKIDLPVVEGPPGYPYCDVAMYLKEYSQPGRPGTTYIFAHARKGMFLPLLEASLRSNGKSMLGALVLVYTTDDQLFLYEIDRVKRHALDFSLADELPDGVTEQLVLQTSEGPHGTKPKLQVRARLLYVTTADHELANPEPHIDRCGF